MSIATQRTTPKERVTSSHKPDAPDSGADVAEAQAGAQSEAAKPRSGSRDNTKFVTPPAKNGEKYDRNAEISRYIRRWKSKNLLWSQAFIDSGQSGKKKPNMRRVYDEVRRPAYCGQRANGYAKGVKVKVAAEHRRYRRARRTQAERIRPWLLRRCGQMLLDMVMPDLLGHHSPTPLGRDSDGGQQALGKRRKHTLHDPHAEARWHHAIGVHP